MPELSKNAQLIKFFAQQYGHPGVPRKKLAKLIYMADVLARQFLGKPMSDLVYIKDHYGPYARELPNYTKELVDADLAIESKELDPPYRSIRLRDSGHPIAFTFTPGENEILAYVVENYLNMDLDEFIDQVVKETDPFKAVHRDGERLPMETIDGVRATEIGFGLEAVLRAERQAAEGQGMTLTEFSRVLRADLTSGHTH